MKKINVIDLDLTLINYDSFRKLVKIELVRFNFYVIWITILRLLRIKGKSKYKKEIIRYFEANYDDIFFEKFAKKIFKDIDLDILNLIEGNTSEDTINILLSASPDIYVKHLIKLLSWSGSGSYFDKNGVFYNLHSDLKVSWLLKNYNQSIYEYNFAVSDSDFELLKLFKENKTIN